MKVFEQYNIMHKKSFFNFIPSLNKNFIWAYKIAITTIVIAGCLFIKLSIDQEKERFEEHVVKSSENIDKIISSDLDYIKYQIFYAAGQIRELRGNDNKIAKLLSAFVTNINNQIDVAITWNAFSWIDKNNKLVADGAAGVLSRHADLSGRDYLMLTRVNPNKLIFGNPRVGALSQRFIVPAGVGVFSNESEYLGTLVFGFDIEKVLAKIERNISDQSVSFVILQNGNIAFASSNFDKKSSSVIDDVTARLAANNLVEKQITASKNALSKDNYFYSFQHMKDYPFDILAIYDQERSYQQIINLFLKQSFLLLVIIFSCVILFKQIYKRVVRPLSQLSKFAVKTSERDFSFEIERPESKEFVDLYNSLLLLKEAFEREDALLHKLELANQKISTENFNKSEFLAAISHDIRNPLLAIVSFAHLIQDDEIATKAEIAEWGKDIENCTTEVLQFINDLMDVNQVASGEFSIDMSKKVDIAEIVRRSIRVNRDFARRKKMEILSHITTETTFANLDPRRMKQILVNLISNAVKYSKDATKIEIFVQKVFEEGKPKLQIAVKDRGFGMNEEQIKKALEKYGTIKNENSDKVDSFGLGLPLVKSLVEAQGGKMTIDSTIGVGTTVTLTFGF